MLSQPLHKILVVTDHARPDPDLLALLAQRADAGPIDVTVLRTNPARSEVHLLHPEHHPQAVRAADELTALRSAYDAAAGHRVTVEASVRHDAFEAVEEHLAVHDADEIVLAVPEDSVLARLLHHDLTHRLGHLGRRVTTVSTPAVAR